MPNLKASLMNGIGFCLSLFSKTELSVVTQAEILYLLTDACHTLYGLRKAYKTAFKKDISIANVHLNTRSLRNNGIISHTGAGAQNNNSDEFYPLYLNVTNKLKARQIVNEAIRLGLRLPTK